MPRLKRGLARGRRGAHAWVRQVRLQRTRQPASRGRGTPEKQGYVHNISSHLLAAEQEPQETLAAPLQSAHGNTYPALSCLRTQGLNLLWMLRKQHDGDASAGGDARKQTPFKDTGIPAGTGASWCGQGSHVSLYSLCPWIREDPAHQCGVGALLASLRAPADSCRLCFCELTPSPIK